MNTLRDRDDSRARPSVWPVCVAAAIVGRGAKAFSSCDSWAFRG